MKRTGRTGKRRRLISRPVTGYFVLSAECFLIVSLAASVIDGPLGKCFAAAGHPNYSSGIGSVLGALLFMLLFRRRFRQEGYKGQLGTGNFFSGMKLLLPGIIILGLTNITGLLYSGAGDPLIAFLNALSPAFTEEIMMRGPALSNIMRKRSDEKGIMLALWLSAAVFGLAHSINVLAGATVSSTVCQVIYAAGIGVLFGAAVLRTGSLWPSITAHFITDFPALLNKTLYETQGVLAEEAGIETMVFSVSTGILFILLGIYFVRRSKRQEIIALWKRKWDPEAAESGEETAEADTVSTKTPEVQTDSTETSGVHAVSTDTAGSGTDDPQAPQH